MDKTEKHQPAFNTKPAGLEKWLYEIYTKNIKLDLPEGGRKWLAVNAWWLALIGGLLTAWSAWGFWQSIGYINAAMYWSSAMAREYGAYGNNFALMWYLAFAAVVVQAVLLLMAAAKLKSQQKSGWNLLFYASYVSIITGVVFLFLAGYGFGGLLEMIVGTLVGWYFLFQIRKYFA